MMDFMSRQMIACDEAAFLISYRQENKLSCRQQMQLRVHLVSCHFCRKYEKQIAQLNQVVVQYRDNCQDSDPKHKLPESDCQRIQKALLEELD